MEIFLVLFLLSGQVKSFLQFFGLQLPVDLTLMMVVLLLGMTAFKIIRKNTFTTPNISFYGIGLLLLFYAWMIFSLFYTSSESYSIGKTFFFLLNIAAFAVPFFFSEFNIRLFIKLFTIATIILALGLLPFQYFNLLGDATEPGQSGNYSAIGALYLTLAEYLGLILLLILTKTDKVFKRGYEVLIVFIILALMALLGARGPVFFAIISYVLYYLYSIRVIRFTVSKKGILWTGLGIFLLVLSIFLATRLQVTQILMSRSIDRFTSMINAMFGEGHDESSSVRVLLITDAIRGIFKNPDSFFFGYGIGSFGIVTTGVDFRLYPHNLILETWFELGLIGISLIGSWIAVVLFQLRRLPTRFISYWVLLYIFLNLMKSSSLIDIRTEFTFFALFALQNFLVVKEEDPALA